MEWVRWVIFMVVIIVIIGTAIAMRRGGRK